MLYFAQYGNPTFNENFIVDAKSEHQVLLWLEDFSSLDEPIEEFGDSAAIIGSTYYNVEIYDERNEEHIDARENGVLYIE